MMTCNGDSSLRLFGLGHPAGALPILCATVFLILSAVGCGLFDDDDGVSARSDGIHVTIKNGSGERIYYMIFGNSLVPVFDWIPHLDEEQSVPAGSSRSIPHDDIMMADGETQVILYWWKAEVRDSQRVPGTLTSTVIDP
jgi:hypothetical protein